MIISILTQLFALTKQLLPKGRAFRIPFDSVKEKVEIGLLRSEERAYNDAVGILDAILPDNDNFTEELASRWEKFFGIIDGTGTPLEDRKAAIIRAYNHPGTILARQSADYIQEQLQLAGFDLYVHENIPAQSLFSLIGANPLFKKINFGMVNFGQTNFGQLFYSQKVVNHIDPELDTLFNEGQNLKCTFFVGGAVKGDFANVDANRRSELRQLILKLKPTQTVGYMLTNYI